MLHPVTYMKGTLRSIVGAGAIAHRYFNDNSGAHRFHEFQAAVLKNETRALKQLGMIVAGLRSGMALLFRIFGKGRFIFNGSYMQEEFGQLLLRFLHKEVEGFLEPNQVTISQWPSSHSAAIGAAFLGYGASMNHHGGN